MRLLNPDHDPDPLGDGLGAVHFRSTIYCRSEMTAPWGFSVAGRDVVTFHFLEEGDCWLEVDDAPHRLRLKSGDLVLLPHGAPHVLRDTAQSPVTHLDDLLRADSAKGARRLRFGGGGPATTVICGGFAFENRDALPFLPALPPVLHMPEMGGRTGSWLRIAQEIIADTISAERAGDGTILSRIADLIFHRGRESLLLRCRRRGGWFAALKDRQIGAGISLIHRDLSRSWTVGTLAAAVGMSRSAFALRFSLLLGESPIQYLVRRRIARASALLEADQRPIARIANEVGYESDVTFSRAFKRHVGLSPVEFRSAKRGHSDAV